MSTSPNSEHALLRLYARDFGSAVVCTGEQVADVIAHIDEFAGGLNWYVTDVQSVGATRFPRSHVPVPDDTSSLIAFSRSVDQFGSGVFFGVSRAITAPKLRADVWTDDDEAAELLEAHVEIRAFDTSYIDICSRDLRLIAAVRHRFCATDGNRTK